MKVQNNIFIKKKNKMPTNDIYGVELGTQEIASGAYITPKVPENWDFPGNEDPRRENILFNNQQGGGWIIVGPDGNEHVGQFLNENVPFDYGTDISVKANWLKRIQIHIWCYGNSAQAITDLQNNINILGDDGVGTETDSIGKHVFYPDNALVQFVVTNTQNKIITVADRVYRFIAWARSAPPENPTLKWIPCTYDVTDSTHPAIVFNTDCMWDEYAVFLYGTDVHLIVKTNNDKWNNQANYRYCVNWDNYTSSTKPFNSNPTVESNPPYSVQSSNIGEYFTVDAKDGSGNLLNFIETYELKGWYYGDYNGGMDEDAFAAIQNSPLFHACENGNYTSEEYLAIQPEIVITAIYMHSSESYVITYYSGLPN